MYGSSNRLFPRRCERWDEETRSESHPAAERWPTSSLPVPPPPMIGCASWCLTGGWCLRRAGDLPERRELVPSSRRASELVLGERDDER